MEKGGEREKPYYWTVAMNLVYVSSEDVFPLLFGESESRLFIFTEGFVCLSINVCVIRILHATLCSSPSKTQGTRVSNALV